MVSRTMRQAIIWNNGEPSQRSIYVAIRGDELVESFLKIYTRGVTRNNGTTSHDVGLSCAFVHCHANFPLTEISEETWAPSQNPKRRLSVRSRKVSKPRDFYLELSDRSEIWQALRQQCCRCACQISKRYDNLKYKSRGFKTLRDLTKRRIFGYWDGALPLTLPLHIPTQRHHISIEFNRLKTH